MKDSITSHCCSLRGLKDHGEVRTEADIGLHVAAENEALERRRHLLCGNLEHVEHVRVNRLLRPMHVQEGDAVAQITEGCSRARATTGFACARSHGNDSVRSLPATGLYVDWGVACSVPVLA